MQKDAERVTVKEDRSGKPFLINIRLYGGGFVVLTDIHQSRPEIKKRPLGMHALLLFAQLARRSPTLKTNYSKPLNGH